VRVRILVQRNGQNLREYIHDQEFQLQRVPLLQS
jgi:hypothetical protein